VDRAHGGGHGPWFGRGTGFHGRPADSTGLGLGGHGSGLPGQGLGYHTLRDGLADLDGQFLQVRELGAPGHPLKAKDLLDEMFCDSLNQRLLIDDDGGRISCVSHL